MPLRLVERNGFYWTDGYITPVGASEPVRVRRSTGVPALKANYALADQERVKIEAAVMFRPSGQNPLTFRALVDSYVKAKPDLGPNNKYYLKRHLEFFGDRPAEQINGSDIAAYLAAHYYDDDGEPKVAPASIARDLAVLNAVFQDALDRDLIQRKPKIKKPREDNEREFWLTKAQCQALIDACEGELEWLKPLAIFLLCTGARVGEALALTWLDFSAAHKQVFVRFTTRKGTGRARHRQVPLHSKAVAALHPFGKGSEPVFKSAIRRFGLKTAPHDAWNRLRNKAKDPCDGPYRIRDCDLRDLRHVFASHQRFAGAPLEDIADLLGHTQLNMTRRYAHLVPFSQEPFIDRLIKPR